MKVTKQKNVFYIDLNKNVCRGYVETSILREHNEKAFVFKSTHLEIESAVLLGHSKELKIEYFNTKASKDKQKLAKIAKVAIVLKNTPKHTEEGANDENSDTKKNINKSEITTHNEESVNSENPFEQKLMDTFSTCYDSFRVRIPDYIFDSALTVRITFKPTDKNPSMLWYKPVSEHDKHKELVAYNFHDNASCIFPYLDCITDFELIYIIPNTEDVKVLSSGTFKSIKEEDKNIIYLFSALTHPKYLSFAAGAFTQQDIFIDSDRKKMFTPCCIENDMNEVLSDIQSILKFIEGFTKTKELNTCNILFTLLDIDSYAAKNLIVIKYSYVPLSTDIEIAYYLKKVLSDLLASQVYHFLSFCSYDSWIDCGFAGYLSDYCIKNMLGNNEFFYNYHENIKYVVSNDILELPLFCTSRKDSDYRSEFFIKKSKLLFHCMEAHFSFAFLQKISDDLIEHRKIKETSLDPSNNEPDCYTGLKKCFTSTFMKIVKDATGKDLKSFFEFYLFKAGLMKVKINFQINKKKNSVKAAVTYQSTSLMPKSNKKLISPVEIKSIELEGNFDHVMLVESENTFLYHTRAKKKKKEEEEEVMPLLYIRIDPKKYNMFEYISEQPDYMHIEQLQEKNVIGQLEAIESLAAKPTLSSCEALERLLDNSHVYFKVRVKAMDVLRHTSIEGYDGFQKTIQYFTKSRCVPNSTILKANEFGLIPYFIQKHLIRCISLLNLNEHKEVKKIKTVLAFYENICKFNDNSQSKFDDSWYMAAVINLFSLHTALITAPCDFESAEEYFNSGISTLLDQNNDDNMSGGLDDFFSTKKAFVPKYKTNIEVNPDEIIEKCIDTLERFRISDMVFPSNNNIITRAVLISYLRLAFYNKIKISQHCLKSLAVYPNLLSIRMVAIEGLLLLFSQSTEFLLQVLTDDTPDVIYNMLNVLIKVIELDLNTNYQDTEERDVRLTERIKYEIENNKSLLIEIYKVNFPHAMVNQQIIKLLGLIEMKMLMCSELQTHMITKYDYVKEEKNRLVVLKTASTSKRIRLTNLNILREAAFLKNYRIRIPRIRNYKQTTRAYVNKHMIIRFQITKFLVKHKGNFIIKFKLARKKIKLKKSDIPLILISKYKENRNTLVVDDFINTTKTTGFFTWMPRTTQQIKEEIFDNQITADEIFKEMEKAIIFVLSYNTMLSKQYLAAKTLYTTMEGVYMLNSPIVEKISPMNEVLRGKCKNFLEFLIATPKFAPFLYPVDVKELKNYADIVRVPLCFLDIQQNLHVYESFDAYIVHLERIYINCLHFNNSNSLIAEYARDLRAEIDLFKSSITLEYVDSLEIIKNIATALNINNLLDSFIENVHNILTWGDFDEELQDIKKKYSRSSFNGKTSVNLIKQIKEILKNWFLIDNNRVLVTEK